MGGVRNHRLVQHTSFSDLRSSKIQTIFSDAETNTMDGLKLTWENSWVHIRKSNTEPIIRIYAEAPTKTKAKKIIDDVKSIL